jgi:hypothetical protein
MGRQNTSVLTNAILLLKRLQLKAGKRAPDGQKQRLKRLLFWQS